MARTIVVSDLHGDSTLLERALEHARFCAGEDSLVVVGDLVDVGSDDTIAVAEQLGATILAGNHEVSAAIGLRISPQHPETLAAGPEFADRFASGEWPLAVAIDGWLLTHAGVSVALDDIVSNAGGDVDALAEELNRLFRVEIESAVQHAPVTWDGLTSFRLIGGEMGPLWFRPMSLHHIPSGLRQIVGHTPPEMLSPGHLAALQSRGWRLVEPGGRPDRGAGFRYAVIEGGDACVVSG